MKNYLILLSAVICCLLLTSCSKDDDSSIEQFGLFIEPAHPSGSPVVPKYSEKNPIGCGYDIMERFFHPASVKSRVIDIERLEKDDPSMITRRKMNYSRSPYICIGIDPFDYCKNLTTSTQNSSLIEESKILFTGEVFRNILYSSSTSKPDTYSIGTSKQLVTIMYHSIFPDFAMLKNYLTEEFSKDLDSKNYKYIIEKYGTHILYNIELGGRLDVFYQGRIELNIPYFVDKYKKDFLEERLSSFNKAIPELNEKYKNSRISFKIYDDLFLWQTIGGNETKGVSTYLTNGMSFTFDLQDWAESIDEETAVLINGKIDFPIYKILPDGEHKDNLRKAYNEYIEEKSLGDII